MYIGIIGNIKGVDIYFKSLIVKKMMMNVLNTKKQPE